MSMKQAAIGRAWLGLGFRPFFLGAGLSGVGLMAVWLAWIGAGVGLALPVHWHAHEMLFGYTGAVIAGFLLTAAQNWTQRPMPAGTPLAVLFGLWLTARLWPLVPGADAHLYALIDIALLPAVAVALAYRVWPLRQRHNYGFIAMLLGLGAANALMHAEWLGIAATAHAGQTLAVILIVLMMTVMGGRVIPSFTDNRLGTRARRWRAIEWLVIALTPVALAAQAWPSPLAASLAGAAALVHAVRLAGWYTPRYWRVPLLWILHLGYGWIAVGFALTALTTTGQIPASLATHAFTAGAMGSLTLGMMARVALGHTGRPLETGPLMIAAFCLLSLAAVARVFGPLWPAITPTIINIAGGLWIVAFALFVYRYLPMLLRPRVDGKPG